MTEAHSDVDKPASLQRVLGSTFPLAVAVGTMIGLGIFRRPGEVAAVLPVAEMYMALWAAGCVFVILTTLVSAEIVSLTNRSGGTYALVNRGFGPLPAFAFGWIDWLAFVATIALKSVVFAEFLVLLIPSLDGWTLAIAGIVNLVFALLQLAGIAIGGRVQTAAAIGLVVIASLAIGTLFLTGPLDLTPNIGSVAVRAEPTLAGLGLAAASVVFTLDGWLAGAYFGGEVKGGGAAVARGSIRAVIVVSLIYLLINLGLIQVLGTENMAGQDLPLKLALDTVWGSVGSSTAVVALLLVLLAGINVHYMAGPRVLFALSRDGLGIDGAGRVSEGGNPLVAVALTASLSVAMVTFGGFEKLLNLAVLLFIALYVAILIAVARLRCLEPDAPRPFRAWGYPFSLIGVVAGWLLIGGFIAVATPESAWATLMLVVIAAPAYYLVRRIHARSQAQ